VVLTQIIYRKQVKTSQRHKALQMPHWSAETMMYTEVHTLVGANLRLSGVETQGTLNATLEHHILLESSHQKGKLWSTTGPLRVVTSFGWAPQLNWRLPSNLLEVHKLEVNSTTIGGSQIITTKATTSENTNKSSRVPRTQEVHALGISTQE
jgi:hypothetical protein